MRIITDRLITGRLAARLEQQPRLKRWLWFIGIYGASVLGFGLVTGLLELCLPK